MTKAQIDLLMQKIQENISKNHKVVDFLIDTLDIGRESVYRRIRGEIPFTFDEVSALSLRLGFSVDEIIGKGSDNRIIISLRGNRDSDHEESFLEMMREYYRYIEILSSTENIEVMAAVNRLSLFLIVGYDYLFKVYYYNWIHQTYSTSVNTTFQETVIPAEIEELRQKFLEARSHIRNVSFIFDREIFLNAVRKVQYSYSRKLISNEDMEAIKGEFIDFLGNLKDMMQSGVNKLGITRNIYLSLLHVETNTNCACYDENSIASLYWLYPTKPIVVVNQEICSMQKRWLDSFKKYSILITQSNELLQENFLDKQKTYIDSIKNELFYY